MSAGIFILIFVGFWLVATLYDLWKGYKAKRLVYTLKNTVNNLRPMATMIWVMYFLVFAALPIAYINEWRDKSLLIQTTDEGRFIIESVPRMYTITVLGIVGYICAKAFSPFIKYNEQELIWEKEAVDKYKERQQKVVTWVRRRLGLVHD